VLVVGGLSLALAENKIASTVTSTPGLTAFPQTLTSAAPTPVNQTQAGATQAGSTQTGLFVTPTIRPLPTDTSPALANCNPPSGWIFIIVQSGESLASIAAHYRINPQQLAAANCLPSQFVAQGSGIFVPPLPANTTIPCGPFIGWIRSYVVQPGDTLFHIATLYRTTVQDLQRANCKSNSTIIFTGDRLWVPNVPTITPGVTITPTLTTPTPLPTETLTATSLPFTATVLPTDTSQPSPTSTP
jgi:LysM repeat protein